MTPSHLGLAGPAACVLLLSFLLFAFAHARDFSSATLQTLTLDGSDTARHQLRTSSLQKEPSSLPAGTWSVNLVHRDALPAPAPATQTLSKKEVFLTRLKRDAARVEAIAQRLALAISGSGPAELKPKAGQGQQQVQVQDISSPIVSGLSQGSGEYFTRFGIGTPPREAYFVMDTGSDLSWTQCQPCSSCYQQTDPLFNPSASSSFQSVPCSSPLCSQLLVRGCQAQSNQCLYQVSYGDGSFTVGDFAVETFTFGGTAVKNVAIGCGHDNEGLFVGAAGLLGLGAGKLSFPTQLNAAFSYCLADRFTDSASEELVFGAGAAPAGSIFTPLLTNAKLGTFYYVELAGIKVGGQALSLPASTFSLQSSGAGGVIVDSGTSITRFAPSVYTTLRDAFLAAGGSSLPSAGSFSLFDTCFALNGRQSVNVPTVQLVFANAATVALPAANYLIPVDTAGTYCFAFASSNAPLSIIGNMQQQGFRVSFDAANGRVGFSPQQC